MLHYFLFYKILTALNEVSAYTGPAYTGPANTGPVYANTSFKGGESSSQFQWFTIAKIEL